MKRIVCTAAFVTAMALPALAQTTTRIEPRPFYGATVTYENGVRVWRPLPPHSQVIIDPTMGYWADPPRRAPRPQREPEKAPENK